MVAFRGTSKCGNGPGAADRPDGLRASQQAGRPIFMLLQAGKEKTREASLHTQTMASSVLLDDGG